MSTARDFLYQLNTDSLACEDPEGKTAGPDPLPLVKSQKI